MAGDLSRTVPITANAMAIVDGACSSLTVGGNLQVGGNSGGSLTISNGARVADATSVVYPKSFNTPGTVTVTGNASEWTTLGNLILDGALTVSDGGRVTVGGLLLIQEAGELHGDGTVVGNVSNGVMVAPGASPGRLTISGNYSQLFSGTLQIELAGTTPGTSYDQLVVNGSTSLAGALLVSLINSFTPKRGDSFDILDWGTLSGTFSTLQLPVLDSGLAWNTSQLYTTGVISVTAVPEPAAGIILVTGLISVGLTLTIRVTSTRLRKAWPQCVRCCFFIELILLATDTLSAVTSNWTIDTGGDFSNPANWDNGVPGSIDTAIFRRGNVAYDVQSTGDIISNQLRVGSNTLTLRPASNGGTLTITDPTNTTANAGIIIGELAGETAIVNSFLPNLTGKIAYLGQAAGSSGTLNIDSGLVTMTGMTIGVAGLGNFIVANGAMANTGITSIGSVAGSVGIAKVDGTGSVWMVRPTIGNSGVGSLIISNGGQATTPFGANVGSQKTGSGSVVIDGAGSKLSVAGALNMGSSGVGSLSVLNSGQLQTGSASIQHSSVLIEGSGSGWTNSGDFTVGDGTFTVSDAAIRTAQQGVIFGGNSTIRVCAHGVDCGPVLGNRWSVDDFRWSAC